MARKSIIKEVTLVKNAIIEIRNLRLSKLTSRVRLNKNVYYAIWNQLIFISCRELSAKSIFTKKALSKCTLTQPDI